jgi:hypothetical protein
MISLDPFKYQQMQAGAASNSNFFTAGANQQQFSPTSTDNNSIFSGEKTSGVNATPARTNATSFAGTQATNSTENQGLVGRLDALDTKSITPEQRNDQQGRFLYELA